MDGAGTEFCSTICWDGSGVTGVILIILLEAMFWDSGG